MFRGTNPEDTLYITLRIAFESWELTCLSRRSQGGEDEVRRRPVHSIGALDEAGRTTIPLDDDPLSLLQAPLARALNITVSVVNVESRLKRKSSPGTFTLVFREVSFFFYPRFFFFFRRKRKKPKTKEETLLFGFIFSKYILFLNKSFPFLSSPFSRGSRARPRCLFLRGGSRPERTWPISARVERAWAAWRSANFRACGRTGAHGTLGTA